MLDQHKVPLRVRKPLCVHLVNRPVVLFGRKGSEEVAAWRSGQAQRLQIKRGGHAGGLQGRCQGGRNGGAQGAAGQGTSMSEPTPGRKST